MPPLSATITATPTSGAAPLTVSVSVSVTGGTPPYSYSWSFGDGSSGSGPSTSHIYTSVGTYSISCTVTDSSTPPNSVTPSLVSGIKVTSGSPLNPNPAPYTPIYITSQSGYKFRFPWETGYQYIRRRDGNRIVVPMYFRWADEPGLAQDLISTAQYIPGDGTTPGSGKISRQNPYPSGWRGLMYLQGWELDEYGPDTPQTGVYPDPMKAFWPNIDWCKARAEFVSLQYDVFSDDQVASYQTPELVRNVERSWRYQPSNRETTTGALQRDTSGNGSFSTFQPIGVNGIIPDIVTEYTYVWRMVPKACFDAMRNNIKSYFGKVNSVPFDITEYNFATQTILFKNIPQDLVWYRGPDNNKYYDVPFIFQERCIIYNGAAYGWNFYQPNDAGAAPQQLRVTPPTTTPNQTPFAAADLNNLFKPV